MLKVKTFVAGPLATNVYLIWDDETREAALIDPGMDAESVADNASESKPRFIFNTHCHFDHSWLNALYRRLWEAPLVYHRLDQPVLDRSPDAASEWGFPRMEPSPRADRYCEEGDVFKLGAEEISVLHLPGHSPGHVGFVTSAGVFSGDVLFAGSVGRWDFPGGDQQALVTSIQEKLLTLPAETAVYPGHGPATTIGEEMRNNPYLAAGF